MIEKIDRHRQKLYIAIMLICIFATRAVCLMHGARLHPDETVFEYSASSLADCLLGEADEYKEIKEYPEGAYVFQMPFYVLGHLLNKVGLDIPERALGRAGAVIYFALGAMLGAMLLFRFFNAQRVQFSIYATIIVFSLIHIEQSRYATGDAISMFLIMLIVYLSALALERRNVGAYKWLLLAFASTGALCAVKYPLIFFGIIPLYAATMYIKGKSLGKKLAIAAAMLLALFVVFLLFSPKVIADPMYVKRVIDIELGRYMVSGNMAEVGGKKNHLASMAIYTLFYSGFPLALIFACLGFAATWKRRGELGAHGSLFGIVLPITIGVFFAYNICVKTLFMRTLYPFFFLTDIYVAVAAGELVCKHRWGKGLCTALCAFMAMRGIFLVYAMAEPAEYDRVDRLIERAVDDGWQKTTKLESVMGMWLPFDEEGCIELGLESLYDGGYDGRFSAPETARLEEGELLITATLDYSRCNRYFFPIYDEIVNAGIERWEMFKNVNKEYYVGSAYPDYYYYLFGYWIKGTTGTDYEFPSCAVYYRSN